MWKVAIAHFLLSLFVFWKLFYCSDAWGLFWLKISVLFQPLFALLVWVFHLISVPDGDLGGLIEFLEGVAMLFSVPVWSICFGWIFVRLDNWLNHLPVLGRKVF
jgi:hypothetical protein